MDGLDVAAVRQLLDRQAIWDCMTSYARGMDRMDVECCKSAFHPDAWDDHGQVVMPGYENAEFGAEYHRLRHRYSQHFLTNHRCEITGDEAHTETYFYFVGCMAQEGQPAEVVGGRYVDRLERRDGQWKIADRLCLIEWGSSLAEVNFASRLVDGAEMEDKRSSRSRDDASYMRPLQIRRERKLIPLG